MNTKRCNGAQAEGVHHPILEPAGRRPVEPSMALTSSLRRLLDRLGRRGRVRPMRAAGTPAVRSVRRRLVASPHPPPPLGVTALDRMGFGPRPGHEERFNGLGMDDGARLKSYVEE